MSIAPTTVAAVANDHPLAVFHDLGHRFSGRKVDDHGAERHAHNTRFPIFTVTISSLPVLAALTPPVRLEFVVDEIVRVHVTEQHDIPSATTIATIGPAPRLIFFAAKADTAPPTITSR